jgi:DNA-binding transcriptional LysR family regulator
LLGYNVPETAEALGVTQTALVDALAQLRDELRA